MGFERRLTDTLVIISLLLGLAASLVSAPEDLAASGTDYGEVCIEFKLLRVKERRQAVETTSEE